MHDLLHRLSQENVGKCTFNASLAKHCWWKIGGPADLLAEPGSTEQLCTLKRCLHEMGLPNITIGDGSNLLFDDAGVRGVVIKIGRGLSRVLIDGDSIEAEAGCFVPRLISALGRAGYRGIEHAVGIPGTLGGLVLMNGGSQRKGIGTHVDKVWAVNSVGERVKYFHDECGFAYRTSAMQDDDVTIVRVRLKLPRGDKRLIRQKMLEILRERRRKFPLKQPNCGSVFLSDPKMYETVGPPGKVIEDCGYKGLRVGGAQIPELHANFIVNVGGARSADVLEVITTVREGVLHKTGFLLACEVRYVHPDGTIKPAHLTKKEVAI